MRSRKNLKYPMHLLNTRELGLPLAIPWGRACVSLAFLAAFSCLAQDGKPSDSAQTEKVNPPSIVSSPAANAQEHNSDKQAIEQNPADPTSERKKQIADDSAKLLNLAIALKAEVDKTTKDTLSLNVIRKADEIEKLARNVREKIKQSVGPS